MFGATPLGKVTRQDVERLVGGTADAGRSRRTASLTPFVVRAVFAQALADGLIVRNPAAKVEAVGRKVLPPLTGADRAKLRQYLGSDPLYACCFSR